MIESILVSACLLGMHCRYDGDCQHIPAFEKRLEELMNKYNIIPVCPECMGGLDTPRIPSEIRDGRVYAKDGTDVTEFFWSGAKKTLKAATENNCKIAVLKLRSPSCGIGKIYDGTFSNTIVDGNGITAGLLINNGIKVYGENQLNEIL